MAQDSVCAQYLLKQIKTKWNLVRNMCNHGNRKSMLLQTSMFMILKRIWCKICTWLPDGASCGESACQCRRQWDPGSIPGSGRSPRAGNGTPLQYSCLENCTGRGAWHAPVHGATKSQTRLSDWAPLAVCKPHQTVFCSLDVKLFFTTLCLDGCFFLCLDFGRGEKNATIYFPAYIFPLIPSSQALLAEFLFYLCSRGTC